VKLICTRYYEADGVRMYSQQTWREVMGEEGRIKVAQFISEVRPPSNDYNYLTIGSRWGFVQQYSSCLSYEVGTTLLPVNYDDILKHALPITPCVR
jgi:hypothetical protein